MTLENLTVRVPEPVRRDLEAQAKSRKQTLAERVRDVLGRAAADAGDHEAVSVRVPPDVRRVLTEAAERDGQPLEGWLVEVLASVADAEAEPTERFLVTREPARGTVDATGLHGDAKGGEPQPPMERPLASVEAGVARPKPRRRPGVVW